MGRIIRIDNNNLTRFDLVNFSESVEFSPVIYIISGDSDRDKNTQTKLHGFLLWYFNLRLILMKLNRLEIIRIRL
jgi:hypothetical protein